MLRSACRARLEARTTEMQPIPDSLERGAQGRPLRAWRVWIPAFAGMTANGSYIKKTPFPVVCVSNRR
jgi:hypothetical protein